MSTRNEQKRTVLHTHKQQIKCKLLQVIRYGSVHQSRNGDTFFIRYERNSHTFLHTFLYGFELFFTPDLNIYNLIAITFKHFRRR